MLPGGIREKHDRPAGGLPAGVGWDVRAGAPPVCMVVRVVALLHWLGLLLDNSSSCLRGDHGRKPSNNNTGDSMVDHGRTLYLASNLKTETSAVVFSPMGSLRAMRHAGNFTGK